MKPTPKSPAKPTSLLAFGAHPDDIEFGCGGVIAGETHEDFLPPLFLMLGGYTFLFVSLLLTRMRTEILGRRLRTMQMTAAGTEAMA